MGIFHACLPMPSSIIRCPSRLGLCLFVSVCICSSRVALLMSVCVCSSRLTPSWAREICRVSQRRIQATAMSAPRLRPCPEVIKYFLHGNLVSRRTWTRLMRHRARTDRRDWSSWRCGLRRQTRRARASCRSRRWMGGIRKRAAAGRSICSTCCSAPSPSCSPGRWERRGQERGPVAPER